MNDMQKLVNTLNKLQAKCQAKHIWFELNKHNLVKTICLAAGFPCTYALPVKNLENFFYSAPDAITKNEALGIFYLKVLMHYPKSKVSYNTSFTQNDIKFLEIICSCNSLEELQVKTDLYIA
jgi:hypothetical protein